MGIYNLEYQITSNGVIITGYGGCDHGYQLPNHLDIPSSIEGFPVIEIADYAFYRNSRSSNDSCIDSVEIPNTVTKIGDYAFHWQTIKTLVIPDSVVSVGDNAFNYNDLTTLTIPDSVLTIGDYAFYNNQLTSIIIPDSVTSIGEYAFMRNSLVDITLSNALTTIKVAAFADNNLTELTLPEGITTVERSGFDGNPLELLYASSVSSLGSRAFGDSYIEEHDLTWNGFDFQSITGNLNIFGGAMEHLIILLWRG